MDLTKDLFEQIEKIKLRLNKDSELTEEEMITLLLASLLEEGRPHENISGK